MTEPMRTRKARRQGFTLVEVLIVLAILVMLVALVVPRFLGARKKADIQTAQTQIGLLRGALERYALDTKDFPTTEQGLQALLTPPSDADDSTVSGWDGPYLDKDAIPKDPWGNEYQYAYPPERGTGDFPDIWSFGPDKEDGTEDDICSWTTSSTEEGEPGSEMDRDIDIDVDVKPPAGGGGAPSTPAPPPTAGQ